MSRRVLLFRHTLSHLTHHFHPLNGLPVFQNLERQKTYLAKRPEYKIRANRYVLSITHAIKMALNAVGGISPTQSPEAFLFQIFTKEINAKIDLVAP